jgi:hypothetical protein
VTAFDRLYPALQHHIVNSLGWRDLGPLQERSIEPLIEDLGAQRHSSGAHRRRQNRGRFLSPPFTNAFRKLIGLKHTLYMPDQGLAQ